MTFFAYTNWHLGDWPLLPPGFDNAEATSAVGDDRHDSDDHELDHEHAGRGTPADFEIGEASATTFSPYLDDGLIADKLRLHTRKLTKQQKRAAKRERRMDSKRGRGAEMAALVMLTKTSVDVLWQNGTRSCGVPASSLVPVDYLGDHEFWPEQFVLERSSECEGFDKGVRRVGNPPLHLSYTILSMQKLRPYLISSVERPLKNSSLFLRSSMTCATSKRDTHQHYAEVYSIFSITNDNSGHLSIIGFGHHKSQPPEEIYR